MDKKKLLKVKATLKRKQPAFIRQDAHKKSLGKKWRSPKGLHSKIGDNRRGYRKPLKAGYHTPVAVRGMDRHGLYPTLVMNVAQIEALDKGIHSIIIGKVGNKRRIELIELAVKQGFTLVNATQEKADTLKTKFSTLRKEREEKEKAREKEQEKLAKKADEKKDDAPSEQEKTEAAQKDLERTVTHAHEAKEDAPSPKKAPRKKAAKKAADKEESA